MSGIERDHIAREQAWERSANCATADPEVFFPDNDHRTTPLARRICAACIVRDECLEDALAQPPEHGVRAGYTPRELHELRVAAGPTKRAELQDKYQQAKALRDEGKTLTEIAKRLGYVSHGGVRFLLDSRAAEDEPS